VRAQAVLDLPAPVAQALVRVVLVRLVPVALPVRALSVVVPVVHSAQVSVAVLLVPVAQLLALADHVRLVDQALEVAVTVVELPVRSVRAEAAVLQRLASRSARNAKSLNKEWLQALVAQLCHVAMVQQFFVCVAVRASKTLPTKLRPLQPS
jgi:hypothetical protein